MGGSKHKNKNNNPIREKTDHPLPSRRRHRVIVRLREHAGPHQHHNDATDHGPCSGHDDHHGYDSHELSLGPL
jgi:hypothetical protein